MRWAAAIQQSVQAGATLAKEARVEVDAAVIQPVVAHNRALSQHGYSSGYSPAPQGQGEGAIHPLNLAGWCKEGHCSLLAFVQSLAIVFLVVHTRTGSASRHPRSEEK